MTKSKNVKVDIARIHRCLCLTSMRIFTHKAIRDIPVLLLEELPGFESHELGHKDIIDAIFFSLRREDFKELPFT